MKRKLAAILAADVAGYSRLMEADERGTFAALKAHREELIDPDIAEHQGRVVKLMGDGILAEFGSVLAAVQCAVAIQKTMADLNREVPPERRLEFRMGINLGDVLVEEDDIYGDGVNVAARLESLADAGGICVSEVVYQQVKGKLDVGFEDLGAQTLKNLAEPVRVYRINLALPAAAGRAASRAPPPLSDKPSLAVLPFVNMSGDPEQDYFSDGLTEDMITELSRFRSLSVIAWNSPHTHSGRAVKAQDVGRELGVAFVVEGSVRRAGQRVRVSAQLIEAASGKHVWADRYDRDFEDIFAVQDEITQTIAATIGGRVEAEGPTTTCCTVRPFIIRSRSRPSAKPPRFCRKRSPSTLTAPGRTCCWRPFTTWATGPTGSRIPAGRSNARAAMARRR